MTSLAEAGEAIRAAREVAPGLRMVVMMTVDEDGNCLDGATPEIAAERLTKWGADAIGCNCSDGPATVLTVIERMRLATRLPLAAMPNAGLPRAVEGRNIYMASPEYMASFARKFIHAGRKPDRRLLRNHAQPHPRHEVGDARPAGAGGRRPGAMRRTGRG